MGDSLAVRIVERLENFLCNLARLLLREGILLYDFREEFLALEVLRNQEEAVLDLVEFVEPQDVWMIQMCEHIDFLLRGVG